MHKNIQIKYNLKMIRNGKQVNFWPNNLSYVFLNIHLYTQHVNLLCSGQFSNCTLSPFTNVITAKIKTKNSITNRAIFKISFGGEQILKHNCSRQQLKWTEELNDPNG